MFFFIKKLKFNKICDILVNNIGWKVIFMINFIVCDDDVKYLKMVKNIIDKYMMKSKIDYKKYLFTDYDKNFLKIINEKLSYKIYILDIETPTSSGIDIARIIRNKDINSVIIFLTGHEELGNLVIKDDFLFLSFINKFDACEKRLVNSLTKAIKILKIRPRIRFKDNGISYTLALDDILYITRDSVDRKCVIKTDSMEFRIGKTLNSIMELLDSNFVQTHRSCIVNRNRVVSVNKSKKIITFDSGEEIYLLSNKFVGELV